MGRVFDREAKGVMARPGFPGPLGIAGARVKALPTWASCSMVPPARALFSKAFLTKIFSTKAFLTKALLTIVLLGSTPQISLAYYPSMKDLFLRITTRTPAIDRAIILTRTVVFDPFGLFQAGGTEEAGAMAENGAADSGAPGENLEKTDRAEWLADEQEKPGREFHQRIYWIRGFLLAIETLSKSGELLHFRLRDEGRTFQAAVSKERQFSDADILPPYLPFLSSLEHKWRGGMEYWGVSPTEVNLALGEKGAILLKLEDGPDRAMYLHQKWLRPEKLVTVITGNDNPQVLTIEFGKFLVVQNKSPDGQESHYPARVDFLLDGRLFKQTHVLKFRANPSMRRFPLTRLRALAKQLGDNPPPQPEKRK